MITKHSFYISKPSIHYSLLGSRGLVSTGCEVKETFIAKSFEIPAPATSSEQQNKGRSVPSVHQGRFIPEGRTCISRAEKEKNVL